MIKNIKLMGMLLVIVLTCSACGFQKSVKTDADQPGVGAMQAEVVDKKSLNIVRNEKTSFLFEGTPYMEGIHLGTGKNRYPSYVETSRDASVVETKGKHTASFSAVKAANMGTDANPGTMRQSVDSASYYPFWYAGNAIKQDKQPRYLLNILIKSDRYWLSVSKKMYDEVSISQYINVLGNKFRVIHRHR